jgi:hypothetical protein
MVVEVVALRRAPAIFPVGESNEDRLVTACGTKCGCQLVLQLGLDSLAPALDASENSGRPTPRPQPLPRAPALILLPVGRLAFHGFEPLGGCNHCNWKGGGFYESRPVARPLPSLVAWQNITTDQIKGWRVPVPPSEEQNSFAVVVRRHQQLRAVHAEALRQADHLFQTLLNQAFSSGRGSI